MHTHTYTDSHTYRYSSTQNVHAYRCKRCKNYILTMYMCKIFLVFEKKHSTYHYSQMMSELSRSYTDRKRDEPNLLTLAFTAFRFNLVKQMLHLHGFTVSVSLKKEKCLCSTAVRVLQQVHLGYVQTAEQMSILSCPGSQSSNTLITEA